jgi:hypothetical protein
MSSENIPTQFGKAEFYKEFSYDGRPGLVVIELWIGRRWLILYHLQDHSWIVWRRYAICGPEGLLRLIPQQYAPRWYYGASLDEDYSYIVVEKSDRVWLLIVEGSMEDGYLLDSRVVSMLNVVPYPVSQYLGYLLEDDAAIQLRNMLPLLENICHVDLVETITERVAYLIEGGGNNRRLFLYRWVEEAWALEGSFQLVGRDLRIGIITPVITDISGVFQAYTTHGFL